ncbi:uncharacterized protein RCO7_09545 [Rhynchosporium graminicola]|uniref:Uncharacterized protein n=1 Tax=Rhynchosporium graminicola TaxID=2792576 RepID=A0A1E1K613_9HELO|nr:uncharacterized protein RCO7_09545 [Rhynchosporium commune]
MRGVEEKELEEKEATKEEIATKEEKATKEEEEEEEIATKELEEEREKDIKFKGDRDSFSSKVRIFYDTYLRAEILPEEYSKAFLLILKGATL